MRKLNLVQGQIMDEEEMERFVAGCFEVSGCDDLLLNMFSDVCRCRKTGDCHHEYAVFKLAKDGKPAVREEQDNFYGHPYGSGLDEDAGATYREIDALMRYYKIAIPGINGGYEHVVESKTTKYYKL